MLRVVPLQSVTVKTSSCPPAYPLEVHGHLQRRRLFDAKVAPLRSRTDSLAHECAISIVPDPDLCFRPN